MSSITNLDFLFAEYLLLQFKTSTIIGGRFKFCLRNSFDSWAPFSIAITMQVVDFNLLWKNAFFMYLSK